MSDSIDSAANRSANRAVFVGAGVKYFGKERQREAEFLADRMVAAIDRIIAAASVAMKPNAEISEAILQQLAAQAQRHAEAIAHVAVAAMTDVFLEALICAARARGDPPAAN